MRQALAGQQGLVETCPLRAQSPQIGRMIRITAHTENTLAIGSDQDTATDTAITTRGFDFVAHDFPSGHLFSNRRATAGNQGATK
jgi:hypothetical protein